MNQTPLLVPALGAVYAALAPWVEALLRFAVGMAMVPHGLRMCLGYFKGTGGPISSVPAVAAMYDRKGFRPGWFWAYGTVLTQFVAAPCVALGLLTRPMALPLFLLMALSAYDHRQIRRLVLEQDGLRISGDVGDRRAVFPDQRRRLDFARSSARVSSSREKHMADPLAQARHDLAVANRVVSYEGIIDAFGHVSMRHPTKPDRYLISRSRSPEVVEASDIYEYTLDSEPVTPLPNGIRGYGELVIHGEIYKARPDVNAVAHHHDMAFLPFCNSGEELLPLYHMGAQIGEKVPFWDSRDEFGDTNLLVLKPEEGASLAKALGPYWLVLMRRHGATVAAKNLTELVFRTHLQRPQRRASTDVQGAGPRAQPAHAGRGEDGVGPQPAAAAAGARLGILVGAAEEGRRISGRRAQERIQGEIQPGAAAESAAPAGRSGASARARSDKFESM